MRSYVTQFHNNYSRLRGSPMALFAIIATLVGLTYVGLITSGIESNSGAMLAALSIGLAAMTVTLLFHEISMLKKFLLAAVVAMFVAALAGTSLGATLAEVGLIALITAISVAIAVWTLSRKRAITYRANASPAIRAIDTADTNRNHRPPATVTHIGKHRHTGALAA